MKQKHEAFTSSKAAHAALLAQRDRTKEVEERNHIEADSLPTQKVPSLPLPITQT